MKELSLQFSQASSSAYKIIIGQNILAEIDRYLDFSKYSSVFVLSDNQVWDACGDLLQANKNISFQKIIINSGEQHKGVDALQAVWKELRQTGADRHSLLINFGGGVIGDLGGFAASTYMRGIDFAQIPTTLLSQVDASVGGKTGMNFAGVKNLVGAFSQPVVVLIDTETLKTVPQRELLSGMAENIKHALIRDAGFFEQLKSLSSDKLNEFDWEQLILHSVQIKADVVQADEKETGLRKLLNFGHTAGHAFESILLSSNQPLLHGEAVALGMAMESYMSFKKSFISENDYEEIKKLITAFDLPVSTKQKVSFDNFCQKVIADKKNISGESKWTLLKAIGVGIVDQNVESDLLQEAFLEVCPNEC